MSNLVQPGRDMQKLSLLKVIPYTVVHDTSVLPYPLQVRPLLEGGGSISSTIS